MNNKAVKNSILIISFGLFLANASVALAYVPGVWDPQPQSQAYSQSWTTPLALGADTQPVISTSPIQSVFFGNNSSNTNKTVASNTSTTKSTTKTTSTTNNTVKNTSDNSTVDYSNLPPVVTSDTALGASAYHASGSFLPTTFFQWIFVVLLILAIIILIRLILRSAQTRTTHTVGAH